MNLENISYTDTLNTSKKSKDSNDLRMRNDVHLVRKFWHVGTGLAGLFVYLNSGLTQETMAMALIGLSLCAFTVEILRIKNENINKIVLKFMGPFMRESERNSVSGFPFYALGVGLCLGLFSNNIAILASMFLIFGDPISSYFGITFGREKILPNKSLQGAMAGFITCYIITFFYSYQFVELSPSLILFSLVGGFFGMLGELSSIVADDNLTIPLVSGIGLTVANVIFKIL